MLTYPEIVLTKLGTALYLHAKLAETAAKAAQSVDELRERGVFQGLPGVVRPTRGNEKTIQAQLMSGRITEPERRTG